MHTAGLLHTLFPSPFACTLALHCAFRCCPTKSVRSRGGYGCPPMYPDGAMLTPAASVHLLHRGVSGIAPQLRPLRLDASPLNSWADSRQRDMWDFAAVHPPKVLFRGRPGQTRTRTRTQSNGFGILQHERWFGWFMTKQPLPPERKVLCLRGLAIRFLDLLRSMPLPWASFFHFCRPPDDQGKRTTASPVAKSQLSASKALCIMVTDHLPLPPHKQPGWQSQGNAKLYTGTSS